MACLPLIDEKENKAETIRQYVNTLDQTVELLRQLVLKIDGPEEPCCDRNPPCDSWSLGALLAELPGVLVDLNQRIAKHIDELDQRLF